MNAFIVLNGSKLFLDFNTLANKRIQAMHAECEDCTLFIGTARVKARGAAYSVICDCGTEYPVAVS